MNATLIAAALVLLVLVLPRAVHAESDPSDTVETYCVKQAHNCDDLVSPACQTDTWLCDFVDSAAVDKQREDSRDTGDDPEDKDE